MKTSLSLNVIKLLSGRVTAQIVGFLTVPILTRLFLPEQFGVLQIFTSISMILITIACLKYDMSIPLARDDTEATASLLLSGLITVGFTLVVLVGVIIGKEYVAVRFNSPELQIFLWLLPFVILVSGIGNALRFWTARMGKFGTIAWSELSNSLVDKIIPILWGVFIGASTAGLFVGRLSSAGVSIGVMLFLSWHTLISQVKNSQLSFEILWKVAKRHKKFPIFSTWAVLLSTISAQLPPLFFGAYFPTTVVGYYSLGYSVINLPMTLLSNSVAQVFFPVAAKEYNDRGFLTKVVRTFFTRLVQIGIFPMVVVSFFGSSLFGIVFGQEWTKAGVYAQILASWCFLGFLNVPLKVFEILHRQEAELFMNILMIVGRTIGIVIGVTFAPPRIALSIFIVVSNCIHTGYIVWKLKLSQVSVLWAVKVVGQYVAISCILLFPVKFLSWIGWNFSFVIGILGFVTLLYGIVLLKIDCSFRQFIFTMLGKFRVNQKVSE